MSSSPTSVPTYHAVIHRDGRTTGPVRLPAEQWQAFIGDFNRRYASQGLTISLLQPPPPADPAADPAVDPAGPAANFLKEPKHP